MLGYAERFIPLRTPSLILAFIQSLFWNTANLMSYTYLGAVLSKHFLPDMVVALFFVYGVGGLIGSQLGGHLVNRFGPLKPLAYCLSLAALNQFLIGISYHSTLTTAVALWI